MNRYSVMFDSQFYHMLCKVLEFSDKVVVYLFDIKEHLFDCLYFLSFEELFQSEVHSLRVVN